MYSTVICCEATCSGVTKEKIKPFLIDFFAQTISLFVIVSALIFSKIELIRARVFRVEDVFVKA